MSEEWWGTYFDILGIFTRFCLGTRPKSHLFEPDDLTAKR